MEASKTIETKRKLRSAAYRAAGTVAAAGMLLHGTVDGEDLLTSPVEQAQRAASAHIQHGQAPIYTVKCAKGEPIPAPTPRELVRERIIALPAPVKGLVLLPLWTVGAMANYAFSLLLGLFAKVFGGSILTLLFQFALIFGLFALALRFLFPHKKLRELLTRKNLLWMAAAALLLTAADMLLKTWCEPYAKARALVLLILALILLSLLCRRILYKRKQPAPEPETAAYEIVCESV